MKLNINILSASLSLLVILTLSSCLKDESGLAWTDDAEGKSYAEISEAGPVVVNLEFSEQDTTFDLVTVHLSTVQPLNNDVQVTLKMDSALVEAYNADHGTTYVNPPSSDYSIPGLVVTIPAGQKDGYLKVTTKPSVVANQEYAFGFSIASVSDPNVIISGNFNSQIVAIGVKNKYDGVYSLRIKTSGWAAFAVSENLPETWPSNSDGTSIGMITSGSNSVKLFDYYAFGAYIQPAFTADNAGVTGFGATEPKFIFDMETDALTSVINDAAPDPRNRAFRLNPDVTDSRYDPDTKTIFAAYILSQDGRPDMLIYDTLNFKFAR